jgi:DNA primase
VTAAANNGRWDTGDIKLRYRLVNIVEQAGVQLKRAGSHRWQGLCPFHADRTPSFFVDVERERFTCFGCKARGDVIDFVRLHEHSTLSRKLARGSPEHRQPQRHPQRGQLHRSVKGVGGID